MARVIAEGAVRVKSDAAGLDRDMSRDIDEAVTKAAAASRARRVSILPDVGGDTAAAEVKIRAALNRMQAQITSMFQRVGDLGRSAWQRVQTFATTALTAVTQRLSQVGRLWEQSVTNPALRAWARVRQAGEDAFSKVADRVRAVFAPIGRVFDPLIDRVRVVAARVRDELSNAATYGSAVFGMLGSRVSRVTDSMSTRLSAFGDSTRRVFGRVRDAVDEPFRRMVSIGGAAVSGLISVLGRLGSIGSAVMSAVASKAGLITIAVVAAAGALGGLVAGAPALLAGLAAPIAAIALGMDGIKRAAQAAKPALDNLKTAVSASFEQSMRPAFEAIAKILPQITTGMKSIATAIGGTATQMANFLAQAQNVQILQGFLDAVSRSIQAMQPGLMAGTQAFMRLLQVASPVMVELGAAIGDMAARWAQAINRMADLGILQGALQGLVGIIRSVGNLLGSLIEVVTRLGASMGPGLAAVINAVADGFRNAGPAVSELGNAIGRIFSAAAPVIAKIIPLVIKVAAAFATQLAGAIERVAPIIEQVVSALEGFAGPIAAVVGGLVALGAAAKVVSVISTIVGIIRNVVSVLRLWAAAQIVINFLLTANPIGIIVVAIGALVAALIYAYQNSETFRNVVQGAFRAVGAAVQAVVQFFTNLGTEIAREFTVAKDAVVGFVTGVIDWFKRLPQMVGQALQALGQAVLTGAQAAWRFLSETLPQAIASVMQWIASLPGKIAFGLGYLAGMVYNAAKAAWDFLWNTLPQAIAAVGTWLASLPGRVVDGLAALGNAIMSGARAAWNWLVTTAVQVGLQVFAFVSTLPARIGAFLTQLSVTVVAKAREAWNGFLTTSRTLITNVITFVQALPGRIGAFLASLPGIVMGAAQRAWTQFLETTRRLGQQALTWIGELPGKIRAFFSGAGQWLYDAGVQILTGLWNGLKSMAQAVLDWIGNIGSQIAAGFKAAVGVSSPSRVFHAFGEFIMMGLRNGLDKGSVAVLNAVRTIGRAVVQAWQQVSPSIQSAVNNVGLQAAAREVLARLRSGGDVFEDLTYRGASSNLGRYNDRLMDILKAYGDDGTREGTEEAIRRYLAGSGRPGASAGRPRTSPLITRDTGGQLANNVGSTALSSVEHQAATAAAVQQGVYQAMSKVLEPMSTTQLARINTRGATKNERK